MSGEQIHAPEARRQIRESVGGSGVLQIHPHAEKGMEADGFDMDDVRHAIRAGKMTNVEVDRRGDNRFTLEAKSLNDPRKVAGVVCKIIDPVTPEVLVITVFDEATRYGRRY